MAQHLVDFCMLLLLQAVLGFDNLLYISLESKRAPEERQKFVRVTGISVAIGLRIVLLFAILKLVEMVKAPFLIVDNEWFHTELSGYALITLVGGAFILYTATKEIMHMMSYEEAHHGEKRSGSVGLIITSIVMMNLVFSFDSILSAMAISDNFYVMATTIVISGILMIVMAEVITNFLKKNRMYEVVGLFILFIVGILLVTEGAHLAHMKFFGHEIEAMTKSTFYFVIAVLFIIEIVQGRYQKNLLRKKNHMLAQHENIDGED